MAAPQFPVNTGRLDPYKNFKFRVKWDGKVVAGMSAVSALKRVTEVVRHREGGAPGSSRKSPGRTEFEPITLERGVTHDPEFERRANLSTTSRATPRCRRSVWGALRLWPVQLLALHVREEAFDAALRLTRVVAALQLQVEEGRVRGDRLRRHLAARRDEIRAALAERGIVMSGTALDQALGEP